MKHYRKSETLQEICDLQSEALQSFVLEVTS